MGKRHDVEIQRARAAQDARTAVERGTSRKYIVDEHIFQIRSKAGSGNQCKGIFEVGLAGLPVEFRLRTRVHVALQQLLHASAAHSRQSLRQQETLIKATLPGFARVQGHGHQHRACHLRAHFGRARENRLHVRHHVQPAMVFQLDHQRPRSPTKQHRRATRPKCRIQSVAMRTHPLTFHHAVKWRPARRTMRRLHEVELPRALHAQVFETAAFDYAPTSDARRRKHHVSQAPPEFAARAHR